MQRKKLECYKNCKTCPAFKDSVFNDCDDQFLDELEKHKNSNLFQKGQTLFIDGGPSFGVYCVGHGNIKVTKMSNDGKESIVRIATHGNIVGHRSVFAGNSYHATATSINESHVCFIDKEYILKMAKTNPGMAFKFLRIISTDLGLSESRLADFSHKNVRERVAGLFIYLAKKFGHEVELDNNKTGNVIDIKLSREEMASLIGTATETLIRFISEFKEEGILTQEKKSITIIDMDKLEDFYGA
jgi:CRP-like cAMP-binding protein